MGYQESFIQFKNVETLVSELKQYSTRGKNEDDWVEVYCVDKVKKPIGNFVKDELLVVVGGERSSQRSILRLRNEIGIGNVKDIIFIDDLIMDYINDDNRDTKDFLSEYFESLSEEEINKLIG